jgi:hypothetical protein
VVVVEPSLLSASHTSSSSFTFHMTEMYHMLEMSGIKKDLLGSLSEWC